MGNGTAWSGHRTCNANTDGFDAHTFHQFLHRYTVVVAGLAVNQLLNSSGSATLSPCTILQSYSSTVEQTLYKG